MPKCLVWIKPNNDYCIFLFAFCFLSRPLPTKKFSTPYFSKIQKLLFFNFSPFEEKSRIWEGIISWKLQGLEFASGENFKWKFTFELIPRSQVSFKCLANINRLIIDWSLYHIPWVDSLILSKAKLCFIIGLLKIYTF